MEREAQEFNEPPETEVGNKEFPKMTGLGVRSRQSTVLHLSQRNLTFGTTPTDCISSVGSGSV